MDAAYERYMAEAAVGNSQLLDCDIDAYSCFHNGDIQYSYTLSKG